MKEVVFTPGGVPAKVDPNGVYQIEQMYAQYFHVQRRKGRLPLLMWHGGGLTGVTYETKPDGKPGWLNFFLKKGWDVYISDAMERGRASWTPSFGPDPIVLPLGDPGSGSGSGRSAPGRTRRRTRARSSRSRPTSSS